MKIIVGEVVAFDHTYQSWDDLYEEYVRSEIEADRDVPRFALETLLAVVALWLLEKAGDELLAEWRDWRKERREREKQRQQALVAEAQAAADENRHDEIMSKIDQLIASVQVEERRLDGELLMRLLRENGLPPRMIPESDPERDVTRGHLNNGDDGQPSP